MRVGKLAVVAAAACLVLAAVGRADTLRSDLILSGRTGVHIWIVAHFDPQDVDRASGVIRIVDAVGHETYIDHVLSAGYTSVPPGGVGISTWTRDDVAVTITVYPDGSYELSWWDILTNEFYEYTGSGASFDIRP